MLNNRMIVDKTRGILKGSPSFVDYWGIVLVILPVLIRNQQLSEPKFSQDMAFIMLVFLSLFLFGIRNKKGLMCEKIAFATICALSWFNQYNSYTFYTITQWIGFNAGVLLAWQALHNIDLKTIGRLGKYIVISALIQAIWLILTDNGISPHEIYLMAIDESIKPLYGVIKSGSIGNRLYSVPILIASIPFILNKRYFWFIPIIGYGIYLSESAMAVCGSILCIFSYIWMKKRSTVPIIPIIGGIVALILLSTVFGVDFLSENGRFFAWEKVLETKSYFIGSGLGFFADQNYKASGVVFRQFHNEYLEAVYAFGAIGAISFLVIASRLKNIYELPEFGAILIAMLFCAGVMFTLHISSSAIILIVCYSILRINSKERDYGFISNKN